MMRAGDIVVMREDDDGGAPIWDLLQCGEGLVESCGDCWERREDDGGDRFCFGMDRRREIKGRFG